MFEAEEEEDMLGIGGDDGSTSAPQKSRTQPEKPPSDPFTTTSKDVLKKVYYCYFFIFEH